MTFTQAKASGRRATSNHSGATYDDLNSDNLLLSVGEYLRNSKMM